jgi:hypothetical protein
MRKTCPIGAPNSPFYRPREGPRVQEREKEEKKKEKIREEGSPRAASPFSSCRRVLLVL